MTHTCARAGIHVFESMNIYTSFSLSLSLIPLYDNTLHIYKNYDKTLKKSYRDDYKVDDYKQRAYENFYLLSELIFWKMQLLHIKIEFGIKNVLLFHRKRISY